jgi:CRP/FNR family transcriptional regulator
MSHRRTPHIGALNALPVFQGVSHETLGAVADRALVKDVAAGSLVWRAGTKATGLYILLRGRARVVRHRQGREVVVHRAGPGATLGEIPLVDGGAYPATLIAESDSTFLVIDRPLLDHLMARDTALAWNLLEALGRRVRELADRLEAVTAETVEARLARHLLARHQDAGGQAFSLGMTQAALARELGTVREVVARCLTRLVRAGALERTGRGRYRVADEHELYSAFSAST